VADSKRRSVCFVTNELYPLGPGGIGRMLYNFAKYNAEMGFPAEFHFLIPKALVESKPDAGELLEAAFGDIATIHMCPSVQDDPTQIGRLLARSLEYPWTSEWLFTQSFTYYLGLLAAEQRNGAPFDLIEFPDFGGWAQAAIEAKRAGLAFGKSQICARIHSTQGMLYGVERYINDPGHWAGIMFDAERHLLAHADLVVAHDPEVAARTARFYDLERRWEGRSRLEFPPVYLNIGEGVYERADRVAKPRDDRPCLDFLFGSRLQPVKRPDLFIRAAILFLEGRPSWEGMFRLVCSGWDRAYIDSLKALVPQAMRDRIVFLENARPAERLELINESIVVVPSDYESLCLFAFEAALAGRKVILNAVCPAFGNGFRWNDGENCLLFDGSVESLRDAMERSLEWEVSSPVAAVPDPPYWLGALPSAPQASHPGDEAAEPTTIFCYGAESAPEFRRQFDAVCLIVDDLRRGGVPHQVVFQLPLGAFDRDGPECTQIAERGWELAFSSGLRECPQMFGKRLAALPTRSVLLVPAGFEVSLEFVRAAIRAKRNDPALIAVAGHTEVIDAVTGRSDYIRVYSGEAPSTALLSSRILPPLCLLDTDVLGRVPFDPWAGECWFETFARTCALHGEPMLVMPMLAGGLDGLRRHRTETNKRVTAGILDQLAIRSNWQARLLSVDPVQVPSDADSRPLAYGAERLRQIVRINPSKPPSTWEPVGWHDSEHGALVHPLDGEVTIGELAGPYRRVSKVVARVRNARFDNDGAEVAIALARSQVEVSEILAALSDNDASDLIALSAWTPLEPGAHAEIAVLCYSVSRGHDKLLLISRPRPQRSADNALVIFSDVEIHFNEAVIG